MKTIKIAALCALIIACNSDDGGSPPEVGFKGEVESVRTFGGSKNEEARSVIATMDGGYAVLGTTRSIDGDVTGHATENNDFWLLKYDADDNLEWNKTYGGSGIEQGQQLLQNADGSYILIGHTSSSDGDISVHNGLRDMWILKVSSTGGLIWERTFGFSGDDEALSIISTSDGGYFLCGYLDVTASGGAGNNGRTQNTAHGVGDFWGLKLDSSGEYEWRRYYGGTNNDRAYGVIEVEDGYVLAGSSESEDVQISNPRGSYDYWVTKIDNSGNLIWEKNLGGSMLDNCYGIVKTEDGNYIVAGDTRSSDFDVNSSIGGSDVWAVKLSPDSDVIWKRSYGGTLFEGARSIAPTADGDFLISGFSGSEDVDLSSNFGQNDAWVLKIDTNGDLVFQKSIGGSKEDLGNDVVELLNGDLILVGETNSEDMDVTENKGFTDILVVKIN